MARPEQSSWQSIVRVVRFLKSCPRVAEATLDVAVRASPLGVQTLLEDMGDKKDARVRQGWSRHIHVHVLWVQEQGALK